MTRTNITKNKTRFISTIALAACLGTSAFAQTTETGANATGSAEQVEAPNDVAKNHLDALEWFENLNVEGRERVITLITPTLNKMVELHELSKNFTADQHAQIIAYQKASTIGNDVPTITNNRVQKAAELATNIEILRTTLGHREDFILHTLFIDQIK